MQSSCFFLIKIQTIGSYFDEQATEGRRERRELQDGIQGLVVLLHYYQLCSSQGRLWCYIEEIDGNVYCKDATKSRKWAIIVIIIIIVIVIVILNLSFPATAALTGLTTLASHQREPISSVSLLSRREGPSATHCLGTERGR